MPLCRDLIRNAMLALKAIAPGDDPDADELAAGMDAIDDLVGDIHNARGPMVDIDLTADYVAGENQRCRVQAGYTVGVTLPNSIQIFPQIDPYDYGFTAPTILPAPGSTASADGLSWRQPRDGTRIEVVGTTQGLWFYRADINSWVTADPLSLDSEMPFNARYASAMAASLAGRLLDMLPDLDEPTVSLAKRIANGTAALMLQTGSARDPVQALYF